MNDWIKELYYVSMGIYRIPEHMGVRFRDEGTFIRNVLAKEEVRYVESPAEEEIYRQLADRQWVVVRGPKGDGLSVATLGALVKKMLLDRVVVVDLIASVSCLSDAARLRKVVDAVRETSREPVLYLDLSKPGHYPLEPWLEDASYVPARLKEFEKIIEDMRAVFGSKEAVMLVVLSNDLYEVLKDRLKSRVEVEVNGNDVRFLRELVETYSGCGEDVAREIADIVAREYDCGRAVLAALAGDWLARHNCGRESVAEALKAAVEKTKKFMVDYIWYTVLNADMQQANLHAPLILLRYFEGPMSVEQAEDFLIGLGLPEYKVRGSEAVKWIATQQCRLIDETIREAVETALKRRAEDKLYYALREAARDYHRHLR